MNTTALLTVTGAVAGIGMGYVLQRSDLCFHSAWRGLFERTPNLFRAWVLAISVGAVGLSLVFALGPWDQLNRGLGFRPVPAVTGGLLMGIGMVVAASCTSGLFYKVGSGMVGGLVGIAGWAVGELAARDIRLPGPTVLPGGEEGTIPGILGLPPLAIALPLALGVLAWSMRAWRRDGDPGRGHRWPWPVAGALVGGAVVFGWIAAGVGGATFGPSTTGAASGLATGQPAPWLVAFLVGMVAGSAFAARTAGGWWLRGENGYRLAGLFAGGALLGAGGIIAGGCNLGHGLSGMAQMNVSSLVVVLAMIGGVGGARAASLRLVSTGSSTP